MANPLTALPELLGKLGSEHFSSEVQRTHIALLKEQFSILQRENTVLTENVSKLEAENKILKTENRDFKQKYINLRKKIESQSKPPVKKLPSLPDVSVNILKTIATIEKPFEFNRELSSISEAFLSETFQLSDQKLKYYLELLHGAGLIEYGLLGVMGASHKGRDFLIQNGMLE